MIQSSMRPHGCAKELERRRLSATPLFEQGCSDLEIATRLGTTPQSVGRWRRRYRRGGEAALQARPTPGRPQKLTGQQRHGLRRRLMAGALKQGFGTELWTAPRVQRLIDQCYGVHYHVAHVPKLLTWLGFSPSEARASRR